MKVCASCKIEKPKSDFNKKSSNKDGLYNYCKECVSVRTKKYRENNRDKVLKSKKEWYEKTKSNKDIRTANELEKGFKNCNHCNSIKPINEFYSRGNGGFYSTCKKCSLDKQKEYSEANRDSIIKRKRRYNASRVDEISKYNKSYYIKNSDNIKTRVKDWISDNPLKYKEQRVRAYHRRFARISKLPNNFSASDWKECKAFFNNECAYCGKKMDRLTQDHFIPTTKNGGYTKCNIIPSCGSCNSSKQDKDFEEWYIDKGFYSESRKGKIYEYLNSNK